MLEDHYTGDEINAAVDGGGGFEAAFPGETARPSSRRCASCSSARRCSRARAALCAALLADGSRRPRSSTLAVADLALDTDPEAARCLALRRALGLPCEPDAPALIAGDGARAGRRDVPTWLRRARLVGLSLESNGGICRSLLRVRHGVPDPTEEWRA